MKAEDKILDNIVDVLKHGHSLQLISWYPDGSCKEESSISISAQEYEELFGRFVLKQENKTKDFLYAALEAHVKRVRELEQQVRDLGGDPCKARDGLIREELDEMQKDS